MSPSGPKPQPTIQQVDTWQELMAARLRVVEVSVEHLSQQMAEVSVLLPELREHIAQEWRNHQDNLDAARRQAEATQALAARVGQMNDMVEAWTAVRGAGRFFGWLGSGAAKLTSVLAVVLLVGGILYAVGHLAVTGRFPTMDGGK